MSSDCVVWEGSTNQGYGVLWDGTRRRYLRAHLEPVTPAENVLRGEGVTAINARKTHCDHGHEFTPDNTIIRPGTGWRTCRTCRANYPSARRHRGEVA